MTEAPERNTRGFEEEALQHLEVVSRFVRRLSMSPDLAGSRSGHVPAGLQVLRPVREGGRREELALHDPQERVSA